MTRNRSGIHSMQICVPTKYPIDRWMESMFILMIFLKIYLHSSCEIENFVETHIRKLCVILLSRLLLGVCPYNGYRLATPLGTAV